MEEQIEVYPYNGILFSYKKKLNADETSLFYKKVGRQTYIRPMALWLTKML